MKIRITEYLDIDLDTENWCCNRCGNMIFSARDNYKKGCLISQRDPRTIYNPVIEGSYTFAPDQKWIAVIEFYCPRCGVMIDNEFLPPGHPITNDLQIDMDALRKRYAQSK